MESLDLYWILQLDNIRDVVEGGLLFILSFLLFIFFIISALTILLKAGYLDGCKDEYAIYPPIISSIITIILVIIICCFVLTKTFLPTTKNMAIITILPKIANNENIKTETKELYNLAKQGLKDLIITKGEKK